MSAAVRVAAFLGAYFAANAIVAFLPLWLADRALSASAIGQILGSAALLRVLAGTRVGQCRRSPRPPPPGAGLRRAHAAGLAAAYVAATGFLPILLIAAAQGIAASAISPLADSLALALASEGRMEYGPVRAVGSTTFMVATATAGWLLTGSAPGWFPGYWRRATAPRACSACSCRKPQRRPAARQLRRAEAVRQQILSPGGRLYTR